MRYPHEALKWLKEKYDRHRSGWVNGGGSWPLCYTLEAPKETDVIPSHHEAFINFVQAWEDWEAMNPGYVEIATRSWKIGQQTMPTRLVLPDALSVCRLIKKHLDWEVACRRNNQLQAAMGKSIDLSILDNFLFEMRPPDDTILVNFILFLKEHSTDGLFLRQLPVPGMHTKWISQNKRTVDLATKLLFTETPLASLAFEDRLHLRKDSAQRRCRILDKNLLPKGYCPSDFYTSISELNTLIIKPKTVIIVENLESFLALPDMENTVALFGKGFVVSEFRDLNWLIGSTYLVYWGDIDTHGFRILDNLRSHFPKAQSVLMDEETLIMHSQYWSVEDKPDGKPCSRLTENEQHIFTRLQTGEYGRLGVRMEQERLQWEHVVTKFAECVDVSLNNIEKE